MSEQPKILLTLPSGEVRKYSVQMDSIRIGRAPDNTVVLEDASLSSHHAVLHRRESGYELLDLGSTNGLEFQGQRVLSHELKHGQEIKVGSVLLRFEWPDMPGAAGAASTGVDAGEMTKSADNEAEVPGQSAEKESGDAGKKEPSEPARDADGEDSGRSGPGGGCLASVLVFFLTLLAPVIGLHLRHFAETRQILISEIMRHGGDARPVAPAPQP